MKGIQPLRLKNYKRGVIMADINPNRQTIRSCLNQRTYYIDFYQREYVWSKETVEVLLNDILMLLSNHIVFIKNQNCQNKFLKVSTGIILML